MSNFTCYLLSICLILPTQAVHTASDPYIDQIRKLSQEKFRYIQEEKLQQVSAADDELFNIIRTSLPSILRDLEKLPDQFKTNIISLIRNFPDKEYLQTINWIICQADSTKKIQIEFIEDILFEPFEGPRDNFLAINWRDHTVRNLCLTLKKKLPPDSPHQKIIVSVLNGESYRNMMNNALEHGELRIPNHLGRANYEVQFQQWGEQEQQQIAAIKDLRRAWDIACSSFTSMKGKEDIARVNQAWENAAKKANIVMKMLPPDTEEAQQRIGEIFYDIAFSQYFPLAPAANAVGSSYQKMMKKLVELYKTDEKILSQLNFFGQFQAEIINSESYLNEEALILLKKELDEKIKEAASTTYNTQVSSHFFPEIRGSAFVEGFGVALNNRKLLHASFKEACLFLGLYWPRLHF